MKYTNYEQYNGILKKIEELDSLVIDQAQDMIEESKGAVEDPEAHDVYPEDADYQERLEKAKEMSGYPDIENMDDVEKFEDTFKVDVTDDIMDNDGDMVDYQAQRSDLTGQLSDMTNNLDRVFKIIDVVKKAVPVDHLETSSKSISTYLTIKTQYLAGLEAELDGCLDMSNFAKENSFEFGVRISDHESGSHYVEALDRTFKYESNYINIDINNF